MGSKIYVGGLPYSTDDAKLGELFAPHGNVESAKVITDKLTGQSRGFGFVEMSAAEVHIIPNLENKEKLLNIHLLSTTH